MIHPDTELHFISKEMGCGVFAGSRIPKGCIVYVKDALEIEISPDVFENLPAPHKILADRYAYIDERGIRILSWDHAKYVNHRCDCNTISSGYGFEIAIRDIAPGEEITDEYGLFNLEEEFELACRCKLCRKVCRATDIDIYYPLWDSWVIDALQHVLDVDQPLWPHMDPVARDRVMEYLQGRAPYQSVLSLKWNRTNHYPHKTKSKIYRPKPTALHF